MVLNFAVVTAYKHFKGQVLGSEELDDLLTGLRSNRLLKYSYILTGMYAQQCVCMCACMCVRYVNLWYMYIMYISVLHTDSSV